MKDEDFPLHDCPLCNGDGSIITEDYLKYIKKNKLTYKKSTHFIGKYGEETRLETKQKKINNIKKLVKNGYV